MMNIREPSHEPRGDPRGYRRRKPPTDAGHPAVPITWDAPIDMGLTEYHSHPALDEKGLATTLPAPEDHEHRAGWLDLPPR